MEGNCPRCQVRLDLPESGVYQCGRCHSRFEVALGSPQPPDAVAVNNYAGQPGAALSVPGTQPFGYGPVQPEPQTSWAEAPSVQGLQAPCAGHPENPAAQVCERCGDFMCRLCTTAVEGRVYCPKCFDLLYNRGALAFTQRQFNLPGVTLTLGIIAFITSGCMLVGGLLGVVGLIIGFRALKEHRARPDLPNRGLTLAGIWISGISILLSMILFGVFIWAVSRTP